MLLGPFFIIWLPVCMEVSIKMAHSLDTLGISSIMQRKHLFLPIGALMLSACGTDSVFTNAKNVFNQIMFEKDKYPLTRKQVSDVPYASISAQIGNSSKAYIVLSTIGDEGNLWLTANRVGLLTKEGRVLKTTGLDGDLNQVDFITGNFKDRFLPENLGQEYRLHYLYTRPETKSFEATCVLSLEEKNEKITILELDFTLSRFKEDCYFNRDYSFTNYYWADDRQNFKIWKSVQYYHPKYAPIHIELLKPILGQ